MPIAQRTADTTWEGSLAAGRGDVHADSGAWDTLPVTWASRTQRADGRTSPEELAAAAHASCFAMALALRLGEHHAEPGRLHISAFPPSCPQRCRSVLSTRSGQRTVPQNRR